MNDLDRFMADGWRILHEGVADSDSPARFAALATVDHSGTPKVRTVALRRADENARVLEMHTDLRTAKVAELMAQPRASLMIWHPGPRLQFRGTGRMDVLSGPDVAQRWQLVPDSARAAYGHIPAPGTTIDAVGAFDITPDVDNFAALVLHLDQIDLVCLADPDEAGHRRAIYDKKQDWRGQWVSP